MTVTIVAAWRDHDDAACALPGMDLGRLELTGRSDDESDRLWKLGARRVRLPVPIDLTAVDSSDAATDAVSRLCLVRDLTARALLVEWWLTLPSDPVDGWRLFSHLQPPLSLSGPPDADAALASWRNTHFLDKCLWRQGPGFIQVRDRRWGDLRRFTVDEPEYHRAIDQLAHGARTADVAEAVAADFRGERLTVQIGELSWWLPYRVNRWVQETMTI